MSEQTYLTTKEVAEYLGVVVGTVHQYVHTGRLKPKDDHPQYRLRQSLLFDKNDVEALRQERQLNGYTTKEVADTIGVTVSTIHNYMRTGELHADTVYRHNQKVYRISEEELNRFIQTYHKRMDEQDYITFYDLKRGIYLFQPYRQFGSQTIARIVSIQHDHVLMRDQYGQEWLLEQAVHDQFKPLKELQSKPFVNKKGFISFKIPLQTDITHMMYDVLDWLMEHSGYQNMKWQMDGGYLHLFIKSIKIKTTNHIDFVAFLQDYLVEGDIIETKDGIVLDSNYVNVQAYITKETKQAIVHEAEQSNDSQQNIIERILRNHFNH